MKILLTADKIHVRGPKTTDNSYSITFEIGEYEREKVAELLRLTPGVIIQLTVETTE